MLHVILSDPPWVTPGPFPDFWVGPGDEATPNAITSPTYETKTGSEWTMAAAKVRKEKGVISGMQKYRLRCACFLAVRFNI